MRYYTWCYAMSSAANFPIDFNPFTPGLESKFALEEAQKVGAETIFGGVEFDPITLEGLRTETNMYAHTALFKARRFYRA